MAIKLVTRSGNISLTTGGVPQSEINDLLLAQEERLNKEHEAEIEDINEAHAGEVSALNTTIDGLETEIDSLEETNKELNAENDGLEAQVETLSTENEALNTEIGTLNAEIDELEQIIEDNPPLPEEAFVISGNCGYRFANGGWDWFIENYGDKVTTSGITSSSQMFNSSEVEEVPFELNFYNPTRANSNDLSYMFTNCKALKAIPKMNDCRPGAMDSLFYNCYNLREIPEDFGSWFDWSYMDNLTSVYSGSRSSIFYSCYSLRSIPMGFLEHGNPVVYCSYSIYPNGFFCCYALDELVDLPNPYLNATWTSNAFNNGFTHCNRLKNLTFATPDGAPYVVNWKSQTIDLSNYVGYVTRISYILNYNSGITADKQVTDDTTYQALKDDPDWWTLDVAYSRYNHDSAVNTINSLPDTSAYLASAGGTNTIKFKGEAGSATDGGAINTLTEEEIAVATAKGWTVTFA